MKSLSILGSTGSIGTQTLDIVKDNPDEFKIVGLTTNKNIELLKKQIDEFKVEAVGVMDNEKADELKKDVDINVYSGIDGIIKIATLNETDTVVNSLVGSVGVKPTIEAIKNKKNIALANKETLVTAGSVVIEEVKKNNVNLMPIDSEHSAIFQCLNGENINDVNKIIITCSGGAFKNLTKQQLEKATAEDALQHPTWNMGNKITIDSATLMNKGFEVIEAHWLYNLPYEKIDVVIHPKSIIHSLVEFKDNSVLAQLGNPDMKIPIQYALSYPKRFNSDSKKLNLTEIKNLSFSEPDFELFPCLKYAYDAGKTGGTLPAVLNAANEVLVHAFLENKIKFLDIPKLINKMMDSHNVIKNPDLNQILDVDKKVKEDTKKIIEK
jgi:1-deoxy-D-xylulose-5-phosphate reductoisomerase